MQLTSSAFTDGGNLPAKYTCDGQSISPPIQWQNAPTNTKSFAIIYDDPDAPAGTWIHWVLYNLPVTTSSLAENITSLPPGTKVGLNTSAQTQYDAPCPPSGTHRYIFHLYALDIILKLPENITSEQLKTAMQNHILATATLTGLYRRTK